MKQLLTFALSLWMALTVAASPLVLLTGNGPNGGSGGAGTPFFTADPNLGGATQSNEYWAGMQFTPNQNITVTDLGIWVSTGDVPTRTVRIYSAAYAQLAEVVIDCNGKTNGYYYGAVNVALTSGQAYYFVSGELGFARSFFNEQAIAKTAVGSIIGTYSSGGTTPTPQALSTVDSVFVPVNFKYTTP